MNTSSSDGLGSWNTRPILRLTESRWVAESYPATLALPDVALASVQRILIVVVLPASLGTKEAEGLTAGDGEVDAAHRLDLAIPLGQPGDDDDRLPVAVGPYFADDAGWQAGSLPPP